MNLKPFLAAGVTVLALTATACSKSSSSTASSSSPAGQTTPASSSPASTASGVAETPLNTFFAGFSIIAANDTKNPPHLTGVGDHTPTKLEVKDLVEGTGPAATPTSTVAVRYYGFRVADGVEFDASWTNNGVVPVEFPLTGVVPGFAQGIGGATGIAPMKTGGRRMMLLPAELGYGARGSGAKIPPNTAIAFIVDLIEVK